MQIVYFPWFLQRQSWCNEYSYSNPQLVVAILSLFMDIPEEARDTTFTIDKQDWNDGQQIIILYHHHVIFVSAKKFHWSYLSTLITFPSLIVFSWRYQQWLPTSAKKISEQF